eukprot:870478-Prymnesium_polylepis.1
MHHTPRVACTSTPSPSQCTTVRMIVCMCMHPSRNKTSQLRVVNLSGPQRAAAVPSSVGRAAARGRLRDSARDVSPVVASLRRQSIGAGDRGG